MALDDFKKNKYAAFAAQSISDRGQRGLELALEGMTQHYVQYGLNENDPIIGRAFAEGRAGIQSGQLTNQGILNAANLYGSLYAQAREDVKLNEIVSESGVKLPDEAKDIIDEYGDFTYKELKDMKPNTDSKKEAVRRAILTVDAIAEPFKFANIGYELERVQIAKIAKQIHPK